MFIQLFVAATVATLYGLGATWYWSVLLFVATMGLAMAPPRRLLDELARRHGVVFRIPPTDDSMHTVYLTIDDSPSPYTNLILDALEETKSHATFFVMGEAIEINVSAIRQMVHDQHGVGNHDIRNQLTAHPTRRVYDMVADFDKTEGKIKEAAPDVAAIKWMRPGCGLYTPTVLAAAKACGYRVVLGDCYGHDPAFPGWFLAWFYSWRVQPGSIVILHDGNYRRAANTAHVIRAMKAAHPRLVFRALPSPTTVV